jgi:hypothetical protein
LGKHAYSFESGILFLGIYHKVKQNKTKP